MRTVIDALPGSDEWLERLLEHEAAYYRFGAVCERTPTAWLLSCESLPNFHDCHRAFHLRDDGRGADTAARETLTCLKGRAGRAVADIDPVAECQGIGRELRKLGMEPSSASFPLLYYPPVEPPSVPNGQIEVIEINPMDSEVETWISMQIVDEREEQDRVFWKSVAEMEARSGMCRLFLAKINGEPAGACDQFSADGWGRIDSVITHPRWRRKGVATSLVIHAVNESIQSGCRFTYLFTRSGSDAERLYLQLGFVKAPILPIRRHFWGGR